MRKCRFIYIGEVVMVLWARQAGEVITVFLPSEVGGAP